MIETALRYWRTGRWLKPVQIYGRLWFRLYRPRPDLRPAPARRRAQARWHPCPRAPSMTGSDAFRFLNEGRRIATAADWGRADWPRLWLYNAHYFDDLNAADAATRNDWHRPLVERWIAENPPGSAPGWEPYPTSLRIVNWVKWALADGGLSGRAEHSLAVQARWLCKRIEYHLLGNHLWANAKALIFAGACFDGPEAARWLDKGLKILRRELAEQILRDGGHFERSPMYHAIVLEDVLDLIQLDRTYPGVLPASVVDALKVRVPGMFHWLRVMTHPDGGIAFFNDAALGIAPDCATLERYARDIGVSAASRALKPIEVLADSGYVRLAAGSAVLVADVGDVGPAYLPAHAHAGTLSFELSLDAQRAIVNSGTSTYDDVELRRQQRGTTAHNTVMVNESDSSEVWGAFRLARRARVRGLEWSYDAHVLRLCASHDGYRRLKGDVRHRRKWALRADRLEIVDELEGSFVTATACIRVLPNAPITCRPSDATVRESNSLWYPQFGQSQPCTLLEVSPGGSRWVSTIYWARQ